MKNEERHLRLLPQTNIEKATGYAMLAMTILALAIANSQWADQFHHLLRDEFLVGFEGGPMLRLSLEEWVNDGLMVIFFFVVGLEIKYEVAVGELSSRKKAALPFYAALGGMAIPALIFVLINQNGDHLNAWGIPLATDIAYTLGILGLLAKRIPPELRAFLIALAIFDDLGAILIIALFYSHDIGWIWLLAGFGCFGGLLLLNWLRIKMLRFYFGLGILLWLSFLYSGIHPTIAGVLLAISIPTRPFFDSFTFFKKMQDRVQALADTSIKEKSPLTEEDQRVLIDRIRLETKRANPLIVRIQNKLRKFNSFVVIPLFVLVNAGVMLSDESFQLLTSPLALGILMGLWVGKPLGIFLFCYITVKLRFASLPEKLEMKHILGVGLVAGIGFTMSLFITHLGLEERFAIDTAKISVLLASFLSATIGFLYLRFLLPKRPENLDKTVATE